jgi:hypothetical protein
MHTATSKVENLAQGSSYKLKFVHAQTNFRSFGHFVGDEEKFFNVDTCSLVFMATPAAAHSGPKKSVTL